MDYLTVVRIDILKVNKIAFVGTDFLKHIGTVPILACFNFIGTYLVLGF